MKIVFHRLLAHLHVFILLAYVSFIAALAVRQHDSFHTHAFDMAYFDNVIWNTSQGRLFVNDMPDKPRNFLAEHFSPALILLAPLYWFWSDARVLLIAQAIALGLSVVPCYRLVRTRHPQFAVPLMLALYLNPALLGVALSEFHEISLAAPFLSFALYAWVTGRKNGMVFINLIAALFVKEEVAAVVAAVGLYALLKPSRHIRMGVTLLIIAVGWLGFVWGVLPNVRPEAVSHWQIRYGDIAATPWQGAQRLFGDPAFLIGRYASPQKIGAVVRTLWPLALLPLLAPEIFALALPVFAYLLLSNKTSVSQLQAWYVTPLLPILFMAASAAIARASIGRARLMTIALLIASGLGYWLIGSGPLAVNTEPARFTVSERTACGHRLLALVPSDASISAQDNLLPHLAHRPVVNIFPSLGEPPAEFVLLDSRVELVGGYSNWPTFRPLEVPAALNQFLARPEYTLFGDGCDYKILRLTGTTQMARRLMQTFGDQIELLGFEIAEANEQEIYQPVAHLSGVARATRVILWWRAISTVGKDYTVFVHALNAAGQVVGQHDSMPANSFRPTAQWRVGEVVKDIHYFIAGPGPEQIEVGFYDGRTGQRLPTANSADVVRLLE